MKKYLIAPLSFMFVACSAFSAEKVNMFEYVFPQGHVSADIVQDNPQSNQIKTYFSVTSVRGRRQLGTALYGYDTSDQMSSTVTYVNPYIDKSNSVSGLTFSNVESGDGPETPITFTQNPKMTSVYFEVNSGEFPSTMEVDKQYGDWKVTRTSDQFLQEGYSRRLIGDCIHLEYKKPETYTTFCKSFGVITASNSINKVVYKSSNNNL
ncbi:hypothetical protein [Citrobacter braakii]|uniref:hypothetical protein n=1 Tax=Citrobacter braakii TaxID=57706 RepID=UPI004039A136